MTRIFFFLFFIIVPVKVVAQDKIPSLSDKDIKGLKIQRVRSFTGESLYGYIDGGADLYLEYGFSELSVTDLTVKRSRLKTEIWKMTGPEPAFGIFSVSRFRCPFKPAFTGMACQNKHQVQFCRGRFYVNVISEGESKADSSAMYDVSSLIAGRLADERPDLSEYLADPDQQKIPEESVLVTGRIGINNGATDFEPFFRGTSGFRALIFKDNGNTIVSVIFRDGQSLDKFMRIHSWTVLPEVGKSTVMPSGEKVMRKSLLHLVIEIKEASSFDLKMEVENSSRQILPLVTTE
ncbi:MAG TPA: DUF6599 family protein [Bacteroidales bacterium]|nr:DUF6599 family protein [Bacteroidales bacterium]